MKPFYKSIWLWLILAALAIGALLWYQQTSTKLVVKTAKVARKTMEITVTGTSSGTIKSDTEVKVAAQRMGRITKLLVDEGDTVAKGQLMAELDPEDALLGVRQAKAAIDRMNATRVSLQIGIMGREAEVRTSIESARASLAEIQSRYDMYQSLMEPGYVSQMQYDAVRRELDVARANFDAANARTETIKALSADLRAQEAAIKEAQSSLEMAQLQHERSFIKSPIDGVVTAVPVKLGETMIQGSILAQVVDNGQFYVSVYIDEADVGRVSLGQPARIAMDAYQGRDIAGSVERISPVVLGGKLENRTFEVRVEVLDNNVLLKSGMSADVEIIVDKVDNTLVVPSQAVREKDAKRSVYVFNDGRRVTLREIKIGLRDWTNSQVLEGLAEGDVVVINPDLEGLKDGARAKVEPQ